MSEAKPKRKRRNIEGDFQKSVIDDLLLFGWRVSHQKPAFGLGSGSFKTHILGNPGFPDIVCARRGIVGYLELKTDEAKSEVSQEQVDWLNAIAGVEHEAEWWGARLPEPNHVKLGEVGDVVDTFVAVLRPSQMAWFSATFLTMGAI